MTSDITLSEKAETLIRFRVTQVVWTILQGRWIHYHVRGGCRMIQVGKIFAGRYRIIKQIIRRGGMADMLAPKI